MIIVAFIGTWVEMYILIIKLMGGSMEKKQDKFISESDHRLILKIQFIPESDQRLNLKIQFISESDHWLILKIEFISESEHSVILKI
jgi:hypothetical protein